MNLKIVIFLFELNILYLLRNNKDENDDFVYHYDYMKFNGNKWYEFNDFRVRLIVKNVYWLIL